MQEKPYVMVNSRLPIGHPHRHFGFCVDLLRKLASMSNFEFEIQAIPEGIYGNLNHSSGEWDGLVRMIMDKVLNVNVLLCISWLEERL